jgi:hypothetical protein
MSWQISLPLLVGVPLLSSHLVPLSQCIWPFSSQNKNAITKNKINGRIQSLQFPANDPMEDTLVFHELKEINGYMAAIFDGHGGIQIVITRII